MDGEESCTNVDGTQSLTCSTEEHVLLIEAELEEMCYVAREGTNKALIDSACPTTVAGVEWVRRFVANMSESEK